MTRCAIDDREGAAPTGGGLVFRPMQASDAAAFSDVATFRAYLSAQQAGTRSVHLAICGGQVAGYVTLLWSADDPVLRELGIPEIADLRVREEFRGRGIGTALLDLVEVEAATRSDCVGLNVGLHSGYGAAQRLYVRRGYLPDGSGVVVEGEVVPEGATIRLDDDPIATLRMTKALE